MPGNADFQHGWNLAIDTYFSKDHVVEIDLESSRCVFRVPKSTTESKPDAYAPQCLGLGPYHHLRTNYKMQLQKISRVRSFLGANKLGVFEQIIGDLVRREPIIRACYDHYLDFDIKTLAGIVALDALYLLRFLDGRKDDDEDEIVENVVADILMVENQIPVVLFKVVLEVVHLHEIIKSTEHVLFTKFRDFCQEHSPIMLNDTHLHRELIDRKQLHLLDRMYRTIIFDIHTEVTESAAAILRISGAVAPPQILELVERAKKIRENLKGGNEDFASSPTASELTETTQLKFKHTLAGIKDIIYSTDDNSLQLPIIIMNGNSEIVLRNLLAYEAIAGTTHELAEYLHLMCGLIRTVNDVVILKKVEIIKGELSDEKIVCVFDEIGRLMGDSRKKQPKVIVDQVGKDANEVWSVKVKTSMKKCVNLAWRGVIFIAAVVVVAVLVLQAFCSVFACYRWFGDNLALQGGFSDQ